jgi:type III pantothenate kinase
MNIIVDYGNSSAKVGIFDQDRLERQFSFSTAEELKHFLENYSAENIIISSVARNAEEIATWPTHVKRKIILNSKLPLPITIKYATPETLGVDRIAGICGAHQKFPGEPCLVIDAGTCITYDFINHNREFLGGAISPGMMMRFQAVHTFTSKLPLVNRPEKVVLIGDSTETCIQSGVINGIVEELNGTITRYQTEFDGLRVILCGGDARFFENKLKGPIFAVPELVLSGLNSILNYNGG